MPLAVYVPSRITEFIDVPAPISGDDGKALTYNHSGTDFAYVAFDAAGTAAAAVAAHAEESDPHDGYLLATGSRAGATSGAQTFTNGIIGPRWAPLANGTTALQMTDAGGTAIISVNTSNRRVGINKTSPLVELEVDGRVVVESPLFPPLKMTRSIGNQSGMASGLQLVGRCTVDMIDGFGTQLLFALQDDTSSLTNVAGVRCYRDGADNKAAVSVLGGTLDELMTIRGTGYVGINKSSPTAWLHLPASTTAAASLRVDSGSSPTSPNDGDIWRLTGARLSFHRSATTETVASGVTGAAFTQTYSTADRTLDAYTADSEGGAYTGIDNAQAGTVYAQLDDLNALRVAYENLRVFAEDSVQALNALINDCQAFGISG